MALEPNLYTRWVHGAPARRIAATLRERCLPDARRLQAQGFVLPALPALELAAGRFDEAAEIGLRIQGFDAALLLLAWTTLAVHWHGVHDALDMRWSGDWQALAAAVADDIALAQEVHAHLARSADHSHWLRRARDDYDQHQAEFR